MKVKILKDGKEVEIDCNNPRGRDTKKGFKLYTNIAKSGTENLEALDVYLDYLDELTAELTGMTVEQLDDLETDEKNKLVNFYQEKIVSKIDFLKSSLKSGTSEQTTEKV